MRTITHFIANEPGFSHVDTSVSFTNISAVLFSSFPNNPPQTSPTNGLYRCYFSAHGEWRWAGRTYTNTVTVPRMIVLYNKND